MSGSPPPIGSPRREAILAAALDLFRKRGFHSVGVDEIGIAAGISGPGVYRHFPGKSTVLVALFDSITERLLSGAEEIQKADGPPAEALERLVAFHAALAVAEPAWLAVWVQDWRSLPEPDERRLRRRQAEYVGIWQAVLTRARPELAPAEADTAVHAALGAVNSVAFHDPGIPPDELLHHLVGAALAVLRSAGHPPGTAVRFG